MEFPLSAESEGREEWNNTGTHEITHEQNLSFCENYTNWVWINKYHDKLNKEAKKPNKNHPNIQ